MKGRAEEYSQKYKDRENFNDWFVNIFWFQNKWKVFAIAVIVVIVGFLLIDALRQVNYDTSIVIAARNNIDDDALGEIDSLLTTVVPDLDGNGKVEIEYVILYMGDNDLGMSNQERIWLCMTDAQYALYLMDESCSDLYCEPSLEYFDKIETFGFTADESNECRAPMAESAIMERAGLESLYASILDHSSVTEKEEDIATTEAAVAILNALLEAE